MASFELRKSGCWQARIRRGEGQPSISKTFKLKRDAIRWATDIESEISRRVFVDQTKAKETILSDAIDRYLKEVTPLKKGAVQERGRLLFWKGHKIGSQSMADVKPEHFAQYRDERRASGTSPATIRLDLAPIAHLYEVARKEWGIKIENPIRQIKMPRADNSRDRRLVDDEEERIIKAFEKSQNHVALIAAFILACETAMRQGELLGILWTDVDLKKATAHLPVTKNGTSRNIPFSSKAIQAIKTLKSLPKKKETVLGLTASSLTQAWGHTLERARKTYEAEQLASGKKQKVIDDDPFLTNLRWHDLRHEGTSRMAEKLAMHELMKVTGHKDSKMLARYYHPRTEDLAKKLG
jgi:integrase